MLGSLRKILRGYRAFREKYAHGNGSVMKHLSVHGQKPKIMVIGCCDSRVDPGVILQTDPGDLFVVRNIANIVPPFAKDTTHHGTSAALEFGINFLKVEHLILWGHSQCGGIQALLHQETAAGTDFIKNWVSIIDTSSMKPDCVDESAKEALLQSRKNCLSFPWIAEKVASKELHLHLWFFDIKTGQIFAYSESEGVYKQLGVK